MIFIQSEKSWIPKLTYSKVFGKGIGDLSASIRATLVTNLMMLRTLMMFCLCLEKQEEKQIITCFTWLTFMAQPICVSQWVRHFIYSVSFTVFQSIGSVGKNNKATLGSEKLGVVFLSLFLLAGGSEKRGFVRNSRSFLAPLGGKPRTGFLLLLGSLRLLWPLYEDCFFPFHSCIPPHHSWEEADLPWFPLTSAWLCATIMGCLWFPDDSFPSD